MDIATSYCDILNTHSWNNCWWWMWVWKWDETSVSEGCQRRKAMECVSQESSKEVRQSGIPPFPSSTCSLDLIPFYPKLTAPLWCAFWTSGFGHRQRSWVIAKWSAFLHEGNHTDDLISLEGERIFAITHKLLCIWSLGTMWQFILLWTRFKVWAWMFKGLYAFDQGCLRDDKYDTWSFLIPFFEEVLMLHVLHPELLASP